MSKIPSNIYLSNVVPSKGLMDSNYRLGNPDNYNSKNY